MDGIDRESFDLSPKNSNTPEEVPLRESGDIIAEMIALDTESEKILDGIRGVL